MVSTIRIFCAILLQLPQPHFWHALVHTDSDVIFIVFQSREVRSAAVSSDGNVFFRSVSQASISCVHARSRQILKRSAVQQDGVAILD